MSTTISTERACAEILNTYLFENVWNEPVSEYRSNIAPAKFMTNAVVGSVATTEGNIPLPTERETYYLWSVGSDELAVNLAIPDRTWVSTSDCITKHRVKIDFYDVYGRMASKCAVYLRYSNDRRCLLIAAKKDMLYKCFDYETIIANRVYLTTYFDSDISNSIRIASFKITTPDTAGSSYQAEIDRLLHNIPEHQRLFFKNGIEITQGGSPALTEGDYIDVIVDTNIVFAFDVDLVTRHERPAYLSIKDKMWKQLIHIPKALNPDNLIYTHDTCDFFIRRKEGVRPHGRYLHRVANASITQVTHNDFAIPILVMDAYRDYLQEQEIEVHVVVRRHDKNNILIREANYLQLLYIAEHDDDKIIDILCGLGPSNIPWWRADNLEQSKFVEMMFDTPNNMNLNQAHMDTYIDTLGYHHVINLLCQRTVDITVAKGFTNSFLLTKPMLYNNYSVIPVVYLNGKHIPFDKVKYVDENNSVFVSLDKSIVVKTNDIITTVFYLSGTNRCYKFTLTNDNLKLTIPYREPIVYEEQDTANDKVVLACNRRYTKCFNYIRPGDNIYSRRDNGDGTCTLTFNSNYLGSVFTVQNKYASYQLQQDCTNIVQQGASIAIPLVYGNMDTGEQVPILSKEDVVVYYNGKYLVKDIDYNVSDILDEDDNICATEVVIQSMDHYTDTKNVVEILVNQDIVRDTSSGFVIDNKLYDDSPVNLQYTNTTLVHVAGKLVRDSTNHGNYTLLPENKYHTGDIWEIQTAVPKVISDFIAVYSSKNDDERLNIMNEYFSTAPLPEPEYIVLDGKHRIYSVFLNEVIREILNDSFAISVDPDVNRLDEALGPYVHFKNNDVVYNELDGRFVDYYPQYTNQAVPIDKKATVEYLVANYLPKNTNPSLHSTAEECD